MPSLAELRRSLAETPGVLGPARARRDRARASASRALKPSTSTSSLRTTTGSLRARRGTGRGCRRSCRSCRRPRPALPRSPGYLALPVPRPDAAPAGHYPRGPWLSGRAHQAAASGPAGAGRARSAATARRNGRSSQAAARKAPGPRARPAATPRRSRGRCDAARGGSRGCCSGCCSRGSLCIILNYIDVLPASPTNWYVVGGLVAILASALLATRYH